ncbi:MAG: 16S rRNA (guanine(966)-N(2))-methyltransferase RsmD [Woeseiaceae bacterium]|nr:16S rRNA (guanine(966)-N(2))-methyltransferase RsmD [Woeseiaceae bacterium]
MGPAAKKPGRLRIVAGKWRSRLLPIPDVEGLRPTSERIRETLFNWIGPRVYGTRCLDLYAGTGALGLEALSREAAQVVFVESSSKAVKALRTSIQTLEAGSAEVVQADAFEYLRRCEPASFDIVFLDPPFSDDLTDDLCRLIAQQRLLRPEGSVYIEQDRQSSLPDLPEGWQVTRSKTAGNVRYSLITV